MKRSYYKPILLLGACLLIVVLTLLFGGKKVSAERFMFDSFQNGRYIREDGTLYLKLYDVSEKSAHVTMYAADPSCLETVNYEPKSEDMMFDEIVDASKEKGIDGYIDTTYTYKGDDGKLVLYMCESERLIHIEDTSGEFAMDCSGDYCWQPYYITHDTIVYDRFERDVKEVIPGFDITNIVNWWEPVEGTRDVEVKKKVKKIKPGETRVTHDVRTEKKLDMNYEFSELMESLFVKLEGEAFISDVYIKNKEAFEKYNLYQRSPVYDAMHCETDSDVKTVIKARTGLFKSLKGLKAQDGVTMMIYLNEPSKDYCVGLCIPMGKTMSVNAKVHSGEINLEYSLPDLLLQVQNGNNFAYYIDEKNETMEIYGIESPSDSGEGGIVNLVAYDVILFFNEDGSVTAEGYVDLYGKGTECLTYRLALGATVLGLAQENIDKYNLVETEVTIDTETVEVDDDIVIEEEVTELRRVPTIEYVEHIDEITEHVPDVEFIKREVHKIPRRATYLVPTEWEDENAASLVPNIP